MYKPVFVLGGAVQLAIDLDMEIHRAEVFRPLLLSHGGRFRNFEFDYSVTPQPGTIRCFDAAYQAAYEATACGDDLIYCEGLVFFVGPDTIVPMAHGWCCRPDGRVVDPTLWKYQGDFRVNYFGVPIRLDYMRRWHSQVGYFGVMDGYQDGHPSPLFSDSPTIWRDPRLPCN